MGSVIDCAGKTGMEIQAELDAHSKEMNKLEKIETNFMCHDCDKRLYENDRVSTQFLNGKIKKILYKCPGCGCVSFAPVKTDPLKKVANKIVPLPEPIVQFAGGQPTNYVSGEKLTPIKPKDVTFDEEYWKNIIGPAGLLT